MRRFDESRGKVALALARAERMAKDANADAKSRRLLPVQQAMGEEADSEDEDDDPVDVDDAQGNAKRVAKQQQQVQQHLTRLMRMLAQHRGMAQALDACPDLLRQLATFIRRIGEQLFAPARRLLKTGRPAGGLLETVNPDELLPWCIDYLGMVGGLADAICRRREARRHNDFASLLPGVSDVAWPLDERYALYSQLKLWSANGEGTTIKRAEEIELRYRLREEQVPEQRRLLAVRLERGARRRLQYTHWAISQLLCTGPILPLDDLSEEQLEKELEWAVASEREAAFTALRPLLTFHFDALLPIFFVYTRSAEPTLAALYQAALLMPAVADHRESSICVHHVRMTSIAANQLKRTAMHEMKGLGEEAAAEAAKNASDFRGTHERNVATIIIWALMFVIAPEVAFRLDAVAAIYALAESFGRQAAMVGAAILGAAGSSSSAPRRRTIGLLSTMRRVSSATTSPALTSFGQSTIRRPPPHERRSSLRRWTFTIRTRRIRCPHRRLRQSRRPRR